MDLVEIPAGWFEMGWEDGHPGERPRHRVWLEGFAVARSPVTNREYARFLARGETSPPPWWEDPRFADPEQPVVGVSWHEAAAYCAWLAAETGARLRLPSEAEWEKAARGDDGGPWPWGVVPRLDDWNHGGLPPIATEAVDDLAQRNALSLNKVHFLAWGDPDDSDGYRYAAPPGSYLWGDGPYGTRDQAGNVAEWVADTFSLDGYAGLPDVDPVREPDPANPFGHVFRGGSWRDPPSYGQVFLRNAANRFDGDGDRYPSVGFRCAYDR